MSTQKLATIVSRCTQLSESAKAAKKSITNFRFELFQDIISDEEKQILIKAQDIAERVAGMVDIDYAIRAYEESIKCE
jgi:hypothetical protein